MKENDSRLIEKYAIKLALGSNNEHWPTHYSKKQKQYWRDTVSGLITEIKQSIIDVKSNG